jgi:hypothetical protein
MRTLHGRNVIDYSSGDDYQINDGLLATFTLNAFRAL